MVRPAPAPIRRLATATLLAACALAPLAARAHTHVLEPERWELLVVPGDASALDVETLFGDDLPIEELDRGEEVLTVVPTWAIFAFDVPSQTYTRLGPGDTLDAGQGFWIRQDTAAAVELDVPVDLPPIATSAAACATDACFVVDLPAAPDADAEELDILYGMAGLPAPGVYAMGDLRFSTDAPGDCGTGCTLEVAGGEDNGFTPPGVYVYDPEGGDEGTGDYAPLPAPDTPIGPWQGFFWGVSERVAGPSRLHLPARLESVLFGRVTEPDGTPVVGARLAATAPGSNAVTTDAGGYYALSVAAATDRVLEVSSDDHATGTVRAATPPAGTRGRLDVTLAPLDLVTSFSATEAAVIDAGGGVRVELPANAFVDAAGNPVGGDIALSLASLDVSNPAELLAFPGEFAGTSGGGDPGTIISLGTVEYNFTDASTGAELTLAADAVIEIPIHFDALPNGDAVVEGLSIPLWSLNEETGLWEQEGEGQVVASPDAPTGFALRATVDHFTWWNCDVAAETGDVVVTVGGTDSGTATVVGTTEADIGWRPASVSRTVAIGASTRPLPVPAGVEVCLSATLEYTNGGSASTDTVCVTPAAGETVRVDLSAPDADAALAIGSEPPAEADEVTVTGIVGRAIRPLELASLSIESAVTFTDDGGLPPGLALETVGPTRARIAGTPTVEGSYTSVVTGVNADGQSDTLVVRHEILPASAAALLPVLEDPIVVPYFGPGDEGRLLDGVALAPYAGEPPIDEWSFVQAERFPEGAFAVDPESGVFRAVNPFVFFFLGFGEEGRVEVGTVSAVNAVGATSVPLLIECLGEGCGGVIPQPE